MTYRTRHEVILQMAAEALDGVVIIDLPGRLRQVLVGHRRGQVAGEVRQAPMRPGAAARRGEWVEPFDYGQRNVELALSVAQGADITGRDVEAGVTIACHRGTTA